MVVMLESFPPIFGLAHQRTFVRGFYSNAQQHIVPLLTAIVTPTLLYAPYLVSSIRTITIVFLRLHFSSHPKFFLRLLSVDMFHPDAHGGG